MVELNITLEDAYNGERKEVEFDKRIICPKCKGTGLSNPNEFSNEENKMKKNVRNAKVKWCKILK